MSGTSGTCCVALGCSNRQKKGKSFHRFPKGEERRKQWVAALRRDKFQVTDHSRICAEHFEKSCFDLTGQTIRLKDTAVPTIFKFTAYLEEEQKHQKAPKARGQTTETSSSSNPLPPQPTTNEGAAGIAVSSTDHAYSIRSPRKRKRQIDQADKTVARCGKVRLQRLHSTLSSRVLSLHDRGVLQTVFPEGSAVVLSHHLNRQQTVYCGFDPTSDSLHVGNLLALVALLHCQSAGHTCLALVGGATALIGDPSGKTTERAAMTAEEVEQNVLKISENVQRVVDNYSTHIHKDTKPPLPPFKIVNNMEWYRGQSVVHFLSTVGRHFRMGPMLSKHSVQSRMKSAEGMNFTEFTYQIFQAYDWLHLLQKHQCSVQIGGNDQLGNIVAGYELISKVSKRPVFGLTVPLVTTTTGDKLGKTAGNAVWLDPHKTSPFHLYQYFINVADTDVEKYLKLFTFLPNQEITSIMTKQQASPEKRMAQKTLAEQVTLLVHGDSGLESAVRWTQALYGSSIEAVASLRPDELSQLLGQVPVQKMFLDPGMTVMDLCMKAGCFGRIVDAERVIKAGGVYLNHCRVQQPDFVLVPGQHILSNNITLVRVGKRNYYIINWC